MVEWGDMLPALASGVMWAAPGVGVVYIGTKLPKPYKTYAMGGGLILVGVGAWMFYRGITKAGRAEKPTPDLEFPIIITDPQEGEEWSILRPHTVNVEVQNPYDKTYSLIVGLTMIGPGPEIFDFPVKRVILDSGEKKKLSWWMWGTPDGGRGEWEAITAVWDILPTEGCEDAGTCNRLGEDRVNFKFEIF